MTDERASPIRIHTEVAQRNQGAPEAKAEHAIVADKLNLSYGTNHVLHDISMEIEERQVTAFIGPSGCGKSTFLRCFNRMNDLIDDVTISGNLRVRGLELHVLQPQGVDNLCWHVGAPGVGVLGYAL